MSVIRGLTPDDILDLKANIGEVRSSVVFDVLDSNLSLLFQINPIMEGNVSVKVNTSSTVKRTMSGIHLDPIDNARIDVFNHRIRPSWVIDTGTVQQQYPLGTFVFSDANRPRSTFGVELQGTLYDQTVILNQGRETTLSIPAGTSITAVLTLLAAEVNLAGSLIAIDPSSAVVSTPVAWRAGETRYKGMEDLCALAGFYPPYFDNNGVLRLKQAPSSLTGIAPDHSYNAGADSRIIDGTLIESDDLVSAPNRYLVVNTSGTDSEISGYYDLPASAPQSYANRGYRITTKVDAQGIETSAQAVQRARLAAITDNSAYNWVEFNATPDPRHDIFDIVEYLGLNYREVEWDLKLSPGGPQSHKLRRIYDE